MPLAVISAPAGFFQIGQVNNATIEDLTSVINEADGFVNDSADSAALSATHAQASADSANASASAAATAVNAALTVTAPLSTVLTSPQTVAGPVTYASPQASVNPSTAIPVVPGSLSSSRYGTQAAVDIFGKVLHVPTRNTFNAVEGVLTLPAAVTSASTYHTAVSGFVDQYSSAGVAFAVGGYSVAEVSNTVVGGFGSVTVDSPLLVGGNTNVRMQNEYDWYTSDATTSVRATLHDGFFSVAPSVSNNWIAFSTNTFGAVATGTGSFSGTVMTVATATSGSFAVGMRLESTGVDGTQNITITSLGTGTGGVGTYNISANVGTIAGPNAINAISTYLWSQAFSAPDGTAYVCLDVGKRNKASSNTIGDPSQKNQWRYSDTTAINERIMQQWVQPMSSGGVLYLQNFTTTTPASYGIQNNNINGASFMSQNHAQTGFVDMLHLDVSDRTVLGSGSSSTFLSTTNGIGVEVIDDGVATTTAVAMKGGTSVAPGRMYVPGGNLAFANGALVAAATTGFVSAYPVIAAAPTGTPALAAGSTAYGCWNTATKTLNIYDPNANAWYHVTLSSGAA